MTRAASLGEMKQQNRKAWEALFQRTDEILMSARAMHCLKRAGAVYVGDIVQYSASALLDMPNLGRSTLAEIESALSQRGLCLGMKIADWPPKNVEEQSEWLEELSW